jgi:hypothetical protein
MKHIIVFSLAIIFCTLCSGQEKGTTAVYYNWNFGPTIGNHFVNDFSLRGGNLGVSAFVDKGLAVGLEMGWNNYFQYASRQTYVTKGAAATTDMYKSIYTLPLTATLTKYFLSGNSFHPYVRLGLGALYSEQNLYYNVYETDNHNWGFVFQPELGAAVSLDAYGRWKLNIGFRYQYGTNSSPQYDIRNIQTYSFTIGLSWKRPRTYPF